MRDATSLVDFVDPLSSLESVVAFFFFLYSPPLVFVISITICSDH